MEFCRMELRSIDLQASVENITPSGSYISNRAYLWKKLNKTPYELYKGRKPNLSHLHVFGCKCFIHNNGKDNLGKFDAKADEGIFLGYSNRSRAYRVFNIRTRIVEESIHVAFYESKSDKSKDDDDEENVLKNQFFSKTLRFN
ncbi:hypothetical protein K1719_008879 [Acacia pycnantha]|nr:hypothetical protein K1719_008879 [Acacia pycnantha]